MRILAAPLVAQTRGTVIVGPRALGGTRYVRHVPPAGGPGHLAGFLRSGPFAGAVAVKGLAVNDLLLAPGNSLGVVTTTPVAVVLGARKHAPADHRPCGGGLAGASMPRIPPGPPAKPAP